MDHTKYMGKVRHACIEIEIILYPLWITLKQIIYCNLFLKYPKHEEIFYKNENDTA